MESISIKNNKIYLVYGTGNFIRALELKSQKYL